MFCIYGFVDFIMAIVSFVLGSKEYTKTTPGSATSSDAPAEPIAYVAYGLWILNNMTFLAPFWTLYPISGKSNKIRSLLGSWFHKNKWYLVAVYAASTASLVLDI